MSSANVESKICKVLSSLILIKFRFKNHGISESNFNCNNFILLFFRQII